MRRIALSACLLLAACTDGAPALPDAHYIAWGSSGSSVTVGWVPMEGATSYTIERGTSEADLSPVAMVAPPETSYLDTGLAPLTAYTYRFSYTAADGSVVVEPALEAWTTDDEILVTGPPTPVGAAVVATVGAAGASITVDAAAATVLVPPGAVPDDTEVTIQPIASPYPDDDAPGVLISATAPFAQPVDLSFGYDDDDALAPENLAIAMQAADGSWISQPRVIDPDARTITYRFAPTTTRASGVDLYGVVRLRATYVIPRRSTVQVNQSANLIPFGVFSDSPFDAPEDAFTAATITAGLLILREMNLRNMRRPARRTVRILPNSAPGYERAWTVESVINGNSVVGTIATPSFQGARYTAPGAKPATNPVKVRFTSVIVNGDQRMAVDPVFSQIEIQGPGSVRITGSLRIDASAIPCPVGYVDVRDTFSFAVTADDQLEFQVSAIQNQPTTLSEIRVQAPVESAQWTQTPEVFTMTGGTATEDTLAHKVNVSMTGTYVVGACSYTVNGQGPFDAPGTAVPVAMGIAIDSESLYVTTNDPFWQYSSMAIGDP